MDRATIVLHLPAHRRTALRIERDTQQAEEAYDANIGAYIEYLQAEGRKQGFAVKTDQQDTEAVFQIDERDHAGKKAAYDWLNTLPDIWNWIP